MLVSELEQLWRGPAPSPCPNGCGQPYHRLRGHLGEGLSITEAEVNCLRHVRQARRGRG